MNIWVIVRLIILAIAFAQGALIENSEVLPKGEVTPGLLVVIFVLGIVGMLFLVGIQRVNPRSAKIWRYPAWSVNPFLLTEPLQFFHLAGLFFFFYGLGSIVRRLVLNEQVDISNFLFISVGAGVIAGVYVCAIVFRGKMETRA